MQGKCDAEIGKPGNWHTCGRKAQWRIRSATGRRMEYCDNHKNHAHDETYMRKAPFAELTRT